MDTARKHAKCTENSILPPRRAGRSDNRRAGRDTSPNHETSICDDDSPRETSSRRAGRFDNRRTGRNADPYKNFPVHRDDSTRDTLSRRAGRSDNRRTGRNIEPTFDQRSGWRPSLRSMSSGRAGNGATSAAKPRIRGDSEESITSVARRPDHSRARDHDRRILGVLQHESVSLVGDMAADRNWKYVVSDIARRCFAGHLQSTIEPDICDEFFTLIKGSTKWSQPMTRGGHIIPRQTAWMVAEGCRCC